MRINLRRGSNDNMLLIISVLFLFIGLVFVAVSFFVWRADTKFFKTAVTANAEIVDIQAYRDKDGDLSHDVYISYTVDERSYDYVRINGYSSSMYIGKMIEVYYSPENPSKVKTKSGSTVLIFIFLGLGCVFAIVGGCILPGQIKVIKKRKIRNTGCCIRLPVVQIITTHVQVNGVPGHIVICSNPDMSGGRPDMYKSDPCYSWLTDYIRPGDLVAVYYDPADPSKYFVDTNDVQQIEKF